VITNTALTPLFSPCICPINPALFSKWWTSPFSRSCRNSPSSAELAKTSTSGSLPMCSYRMGRTSITRWSRTAGAGGTGSMRRSIPNLRNWRAKHEPRKKVCGLILHPFRRGLQERKERAITRPLRPCAVGHRNQE